MVSREISHIIPFIYESLDAIRWPPQFYAHPFEQTQAAIDCTSHFRNRVHPRQADYYRYDKHGFFFSAQILCGLGGELFDVQIGLGHNNDRGMLKLTGLKQKFIEEGSKILGDRGYSWPIITPDETKSISWNNQQKALRSVKY